MRKISISLFFIILMFACDKASFIPSGLDCNDIPTYDDVMKEIVDRNCATSNCHDGGSQNGDYSTYDRMSQHFLSSIESRVITLKDDTVFGMPPNYATNGPIDLSEEDFMLFNCWITEGFPEN